jgi:four helix bundle protein
MSAVKVLEDLDIFQLAMQIGDEIWKLTGNWNDFSRRTIGTQMVRSADSIAANIAEGYGRYFYKDRKLFYYYSRGSVLETKTWLIKALNRNLFTFEKYTLLIKLLSELHYKLNSYIKKLK